MSLQRGANIRGWEGVTRNLAINSQERTAWNFFLFSMTLTLIIVGLAGLLLSQSDIPTLAKTILVLGVLLFTRVMISGIYSTTMRRAEGVPHDDDPEKGRSRGDDTVNDLVTDAPSLDTVRSTATLSAAEPTTETPAAAQATPQPAAETADGPADPGIRPTGLAAARGGQADDLTKIKGVGPKLAELCHSLGFYHFDQIAAWTADEVAWVDQNLEGFKGRVTRDEWVSQAKILAAGGETEFSARTSDS